MPAAPNDLSHAQLQQLVGELGVYQAALEQQNRVLMHAVAGLQTSPPDSVADARDQALLADCPRGSTDHACTVQDSQQRWKFALEGSGEGVWDWHIDTGYAVFSTRYKEMLGYADDEIGNQASEWSSRVHPDDMPQVSQILQAHLDGQTSALRVEFRARCKDGRWRWILGRGMVVARDAAGKALRLVGTNCDIHAQKQAQQQEQLRSAVLELLSSDAPCEQVLQALLQGLQQMEPGLLCSILLLDQDGRRFARSLAPSLPEFYTAALLRLEVGAGLGSCGTAAYLGQRVVVPDIASHADWQDFAGLAARAGLAACWSQPIRGATGRVLGTFAIYRRQVHQPDAAEFALVEHCAHLASITLEKHQTMTQLQQSEDRYRTIVEHSPDPVGVFRRGRLIYVNAAAISLLRTGSAQDLLGCLVLDLVHPDDRAAVQARVRVLTEPGASTALQQHRLQCQDGSVVTVEAQSTLMLFKGTLAIHVVEAQSTLMLFKGTLAIHVVARDISARLQAEARQRLAAAVFSHAREGILILALDGLIIDLNAAVTQITGYSRDEVLGQNPRDRFCAGLHGPEVFEAMARELREQGFWSGELWNRRKNGEVFAAWHTISMVHDEAGQAQHMVLLFSDISARKEHETQLEQMAHFDVLTGLPNRILLSDRMTQAMAQAQRRQQSIALVYLDLDGFKAVNDSLGHAVGDRLLIALASRMKQTLREGDTLARIGGDEFVAVLPDLNRTSCTTMMTRLLEAVALPVWIDDARLDVSASLGITFYPQADELDATDLLHQADGAMYQSKLAGKNCFHFFTATGSTDAAADC
ncbi:MAG: diguanylate cyclase domain-containing protein [Rhodoferax sp.]